MKSELSRWASRLLWNGFKEAKNEIFTKSVNCIHLITYCLALIVVNMFTLNLNFLGIKESFYAIIYQTIVNTQPDNSQNEIHQCQSLKKNSLFFFLQEILYHLNGKCDDKSLPCFCGNITCWFHTQYSNYWFSTLDCDVKYSEVIKSWTNKENMTVSKKQLF